MEKRKAGQEGPKYGESLNKVKNIIEEIYKQTPELEDEVKRDDLSIFKLQLPKTEASAEKEKIDKPDIKILEEKFKKLKKDEDMHNAKMNGPQIEEEYRQARELYMEYEKYAGNLVNKMNEMDEREIRREQNLRDRIKEREEEISKKGGLDQLPDKKIVGQIKETHGQIISSLEDLQKMTQKALEQERTTIKTYFSGEILKMQDEFNKEKEKQATSTEGQKEGEKELKANLEIVTTIAQHIDAVNRKLTKKKDELKIEVKAQENDNEMLLK